MKRILIGLFVVFVSYLLWSLLSACGSWSVFGANKEKPSCTCIGKIIKTGGPKGPADDFGGTFNCVGLIISKQKLLNRNTSEENFVCPKGDYVNCMPGIIMPGERRPRRDSNCPEGFLCCSEEYLEKAKRLCPGFKGASY